MLAVVSVHNSLYPIMLFTVLFCFDLTEYTKSLRSSLSLNRTISLQGDSEREQNLDSWGDWTEWTRCSRECGGGRQSRMRDCLFEKRAQINCSGDRVQIQDCNTHNCPGEYIMLRS